MHRHRGLPSAFTAALSSLVLLPVFFCAAPADLAMGQEPPTAATTKAEQEPVFVVPETEAGQVLAAVLNQARATDRLVFLHSGADW
jgi:hypothetical protein